MEVTGRDRVHFFRRPILPNTTPLPYIRYAREIQQDVADIKRRDRVKEESSMNHVTFKEPMSPTKVVEHFSCTIFLYLHLSIYVYLEFMNNGIFVLQHQQHRRLPRNRKNQRKLDHLDLAYGLEGSPASKITPMPPGARSMLRRGYATQTDHRDSEAQTDPTTLGNVIEYLLFLSTSLIVLMYMHISNIVLETCIIICFRLWLRIQGCFA